MLLVLLKANECACNVYKQTFLLEEWIDMKEQLVKAMQRNQIVNMMYIAKDGSITKRRVKVIKIIGESFQAYCFIRQAKRTFMIDSVLAVVPNIHKERSVV